MRIICTLLLLIGILCTIPQFFISEPVTLPFLILDCAVVYMCILTTAMWIPNPGAPTDD